MKLLENLSIFVINSDPIGVKFTIHVYAKLVVINAYTNGTETLKYGIQYKANMPSNLKVLDAAAAITGNNSSAGQLIVSKGKLLAQSSSATTPLTNTFMGQIITFLKD